MPAAKTDSRTHAYRLGLAGKALPPRLATSGDESVLDAWREGKADRPGDQPTTAGADRHSSSSPRRSSGTESPRSSTSAKSGGSSGKSGGSSSPKASLFSRGSSSTRSGLSRLGHGTSPATGTRTRYSVVIAVEYLACMAMIALSGGGVGKGQDAPVLADPAIVLVRLTAVSFLFFILALLSAGEKVGKLAAAFGGLVTLGVAFNAVGEWRALADLFTGGGTGVGAGPVGSPGGNTGFPPPAHGPFPPGQGPGSPGPGV